MINTLNFNMHNILTFQINRKEKNDVFPDLNLPFLYFLIHDEIMRPDIILNIGPFKPSNDTCRIVDNKYYVKHDYFYCKDETGSARWEIEINGLESGNAVINYHGTIMSPEKIIYPHLLPQDLFLNPMIEYALFKKRYAFVHAAGICHRDKGYIFVGRGTSFKTSICMDLMRKKEFSLLGDERVILSQDGRVLSCPIHHKVFDFKTNHLSNEEFLSSKKLSICGMLRYLRFLKSMNSATYKIKSKIADSAHLQSVTFLNRMNSSKMNIYPVPLDLAVSRLIFNNDAEKIKGHTFFWFDNGQIFLKYLLAYSFIYPDNCLTSYNTQLNVLLSAILSKSKLYELCFGANYTPEITDKLSSIFLE